MQATIPRSALDGLMLGMPDSPSLGLSGCMVNDMLEKKEAAKDEVATKEHFEESAQTYYEGGRYQQSVQMWRKVLEMEPERQKAKWGLAKSLSKVGTPPALR